MAHLTCRLYEPSRLQLPKFRIGEVEIDQSIFSHLWQANGSYFWGKPIAALDKSKPMYLGTFFASFRDARFISSHPREILVVLALPATSHQ